MSKVIRAVLYTAVAGLMGYNAYEQWVIWHSFQHSSMWLTMAMLFVLEVSRK